MVTRGFVMWNCYFPHASEININTRTWFSGAKNNKIVCALFYSVFEYDVFAFTRIHNRDSPMFFEIGCKTTNLKWFNASCECIVWTGTCQDIVSLFSYINIVIIWCFYGNPSLTERRLIELIVNLDSIRSWTFGITFTTDLPYGNSTFVWRHFYWMK